jgi:hypothetical protein
LTFTTAALLTGLLFCSASSAARSFGQRQDHPVGSRPVAVATGVLGPDRTTAVVTADRDSDDVSVLPSNRNGKIGRAETFGVGSQPTDVAMADFNGDGKDDVVTANSGSGDVSVRLGRNRRLLGKEHTYATGPVSSVAVGDLNGDGDVDLLTDGGDTVAALLGNGDGTFQPATGGADVPSGSIDFSQLRIGDLDGDGFLDLVAPAGDDDPGATGGRVAVEFGRGDGNFGDVSYVDTLSFPERVALADVDDDGDLDLAVLASYYKSAGIQVFAGDGAGGFTPTGTYGSPGPLGYAPTEMAFADVNGDGIVDLLSRGGVVDENYSFGDFHVMAGAGDGTFGPSVDYGLDIGFGPFTVARLGKDPAPDLIAVNPGADSVTIFLRRGF